MQAPPVIVVILNYFIEKTKPILEIFIDKKE